MESKENREDSDDSQSSEEVEDHSEKSESSPAKSHGKEITKAKPKGQSQKPSHPSTAEMVNNAIKELKERKGSSVQAIKKYIGTMYEVDVEKLTPFIKKYLKNAVTTGTLIQSSGKGASGSFKLPKTVSSMKKSQGKPNTLTQKKAMKSPGQKKKEAKIISPTKEVSPKKKSKAVSPKKRGQTVSPKKRGQTVSPTKKVVTVSSTKEASVSPKKAVKKKTPSKTETKSSPTKKSASKEKKSKSPKIKAKVPKPKKAAEAKPKTKIPSK